MNWKIARDPYFAEVAQRWGEESVWEGGFFLDDNPSDAPLDDVGWLCTPTAAVRRGLTECGDDSNPVVLLATGGFWPPHRGHVAMMVTARQAVEATGQRVVGGYLSPGHDDYLQLKWGALAPPAAERLAVLRSHIAEHPWLDVDPWEALHRTTSVNFTDVVVRLQNYLRARVDERIRVAYVCGGDNARFALAFGTRGRCVVVGRPGSEGEMERWRADPRLDRPRVWFVDGDVVAASSSMTPEVSESSRTTLRLRVEDERAVVGLQITRSAWRRFQRALVDRLADCVTVTPIPIERQPTVARRQTISLDPMNKGAVDIGVSRLFDCGGTRQLGYVARPGWPSLGEQMASIPPGRWTLIEDDRMTGGTIRFLREQLPSGVEIVEEVLGMRDASGGDIADSRDFLLGSACGGLAVSLPDGSVGRAPYLLPYVDPSARCGIPAADVVRFSRDVWALNAVAFDGSNLRVADLDEVHRSVLRVAGHGVDEPLADVCRWHEETLDGLIVRSSS